MVFQWPTPQIDNIVPMQHIPTMPYAIAIEKTGSSFSAYVPDLPGCIATGQSKAQIENDMRKAIRFHIDGLLEDGLPVPHATSIAEYVEARSKR